MAKVKNINGTSQNRCSCGSWLKHNASSRELEIFSSYALISANKKETCEK